MSGHRAYIIYAVCASRQKTFSPGPYDSKGSCPCFGPWPEAYGAHLRCRFPGSPLHRLSWIALFHGIQVLHFTSGQGDAQTGPET